MNKTLQGNAREYSNQQRTKFFGFLNKNYVNNNIYNFIVLILHT